MNKRSFYISVVLLINLFMGINCKKPISEEQLPAETQEGKFTFGCKVDGKIYSASGKGDGIASDHVYFNFIPEDSSINIGAGTTSSTKNKFSIYFTIKYTGSIGTFLMNTFPYEGVFLDESNGNIPAGSNSYSTSDSHTGKINIKYFDGIYNPFKKGTVLSGTFEMDAVNTAGKAIHITEGRFDIGQ